MFLSSALKGSLRSQESSSTIMDMQEEWDSLLTHSKHARNYQLSLQDKSSSLYDLQMLTSAS